MAPSIYEVMRHTNMGDGSWGHECLEGRFASLDGALLYIARNSRSGRAAQYALGMYQFHPGDTFKTDDGNYMYSIHDLSVRD